MKKEQHYLSSSFREKIIEHLFVGELLKISWQEGHSLEISRPEVDNHGYDLIIESNGILRHVQLKTSYSGAKASRQKVSIALAAKISGCVIWIYFNEDSLNLGPFLFLGGNGGEPLLDISRFKIAKHEKHDAQGNRAERPNIRSVNKGHFEKFDSIHKLYHKLFSV